MGTRNESKVENGSIIEEPRKTAGLEWAAEPNDVLIIVPSKFIMIGISSLIVLVSIVCWIGSSAKYDYFVWSVLATLYIGLIIFLPEYFSNIINFAINFIYWIAFCLYALVETIRISTWQHIVEDARKKGASKAELEEAQQILSYAITCGVIIFLLSILVLIFMSRMVFYYYKNR